MIFLSNAPYGVDPIAVPHAGAKSYICDGTPPPNITPYGPMKAFQQGGGDVTYRLDSNAMAIISRIGGEWFDYTILDFGNVIQSLTPESDPKYWAERIYPAKAIEIKCPVAVRANRVNDRPVIEFGFGDESDYLIYRMNQ